jgi:hypothetical protein
MKRKIDVAWVFVTKRAAAHTPCNNYFKTLLRNKSLKEVLAEGDIILHCLVPKDGYTLADLPDACTAGRDIGINPYLLIDEKIGLAPVLIHELAHVAGASTNPDPYVKQSIAAEKALLHCLCSKQYRPEAIGSIQLQGYAGGHRIHPASGIRRFPDCLTGHAPTTAARSRRTLRSGLTASSRPGTPFLKTPKLLHLLRPQI